MKRLFVLGISFLFFLPRLWAQSPLMLEVDPLAYAMEGHSGAVKFPLFGSPWVFGGGTFALKLPQAALEQEAQDKDVQMEILPGSRAFALDWFLDPKDNYAGWHFGVMRAQLNYRLERKELSQEAEFKTQGDLFRFGYQWYLSESFYLDFWAGSGKEALVSGETQVGDYHHEIPSRRQMATLHLGYAF